MTFIYGYDNNKVVVVVVFVVVIHFNGLLG